MKRTEAPCPACGSPVEFRVSSSLVAVCQQCSSLVARRDRKLEDQGRTAALVETRSPLAIGLTGSYDHKSFEIVGRTQYRHVSGAVWDEWYAAFSNGRWGWIAEAQGKFYLTFPQRLAADSRLLPHQSLQPGSTLALEGGNSYVVVDLGPSRRIAAAGELPFLPQLDAEHRFADCAGPDGRFATLDYDTDPPSLFLGRQTTLAELEISPEIDVHADPKEVGAVLIDCPNCGGSLETHAIDRIERIVCPYCSGVLDCDQGTLRYLKPLDAGHVRPLLPIGRTGDLRGIRYTVIGFLQRAVTIEGRDYFWTEYLLYGADASFRWLVQSDGHWNFVEPLSPGDVRLRGDSAECRGRRFKLFQRAVARVTYVLGEFTWKVEVGERVEASDYVAPPLALSVEVSGRSPTGGAGGEVNTSLAHYLPLAEVEAAFQTPRLPRGWSVAPNQPNPVDSRIYLWWVLFLIALAALDVAVGWLRGFDQIDQGWAFLGFILLSLVPGGALFVAHGFEKSRWEESMFGPDH